MKLTSPLFSTTCSLCDVTDSARGLAQNMAGRVVSLRGIHRIVTAVRPSAARPGVAKWISSAPRCSQQQSMLPSLAVATSRLHTQHWKRQEVVQCRRYAGGGTTMTLSELQEQVINVLKMFDKIDPDKVSVRP